MDEIYIKATDVNEWISKYFKNKDLISVGDLIGCIEDLDSEIERLNDKIKDLKQEEFDPYSEYGVSERDFH